MSTLPISSRSVAQFTLPTLDFLTSYCTCICLLTYYVIDGCVTADRLCFVTLKKKPRSSPTVHYFSTDDEFFYNRLLTFLSCLQMKTMLDVNEVVLALRFGFATVRVCHNEGCY